MSDHLILLLLVASSAIAAIAALRAHHWHCELGRHRDR